MTPKNIAIDTTESSISVDFFFKLPFAARVTIWMLGAYLSAFPVEWVISNYRIERCIALLPGYALCGLTFYFLRFSCRFIKNLSKKCLGRTAIWKRLRVYNIALWHCFGFGI